MRHAIWVIAGAAISVLTCTLPANAASITNAIINASKTSYHGPCPVTIDFNGTIIGKPGTGFTYSFNHIIDSGAPSEHGTTTTTMPAGAMLKVTDSITISKSSSGVTFDQIWVHNIAGGQSDVYSNEAHFSVTCGAPPTPRPIVAPTRLKLTKNAQVCGQHGGFAALFCPGALHAGYLVLVWNYPAKHQASIDGYHIYVLPPGTRKLVDTSEEGQATIGFVKPEKGGFGGRCYRVYAFEGKRESDPSNIFCVPKNYKYNGPPTVVRSLTLPQTASWCHWQEKGWGVTPIGTGCGPISMGYSNYYSWPNNDHLILQSQPVYDVTSIKGMHVFRATLVLTNPQAQTNAPNLQSENYSCFGGIGFATAPYAGGDTWTPGDFTSFAVHTHFKAESSTIDVTSIVQAWASGKIPNNGFVFRGLDESLSASNNNTCIENFDQNAALNVEVW